MKLKSLHIAWLIYFLIVGGYALHFHLSEKTDEAFESAGRFAVMFGSLLIVMIVGTILEWLTSKK